MSLLRQQAQAPPAAFSRAGGEDLSLTNEAAGFRAPDAAFEPGIRPSAGWRTRLSGYAGLLKAALIPGLALLLGAVPASAQTMGTRYQIWRVGQNVLGSQTYGNSQTLQSMSPSGQSMPIAGRQNGC